MTPVRLQHVAKLNTEVRSTAPRPFIALENLESWTGSIAPDVELSVVTPPESGAASVEIGDVLFGKLRPYLAKTWLADRSAYASTELLCLRPQPGVDSRWFAYLMRSRPLVEWAIATSDGTKMPRTSWDELRYFKARVPSIDQQRAIADYLDRETSRIDKLIAAKRRMIALASERFESWREGVLLSAPTIIWTPLQRLTDPDRPIVYGVVQPGPETANGVPYIKSGDVVQFNPEDLSHTSPEIDEAYRRARVRPGDIVIAMRASIGAVVRIPPVVPTANLTQGTARIAPRVGVDPVWLLHALATRAVQSQCEVRAVGTTFKTLNIWDLRRLSIPTPSGSQQKRLASSVAKADFNAGRWRAQAARQIELLRERLQTLVAELVQGTAAVPRTAA